MNKHFNIRVYGLLINELDQILISDECRNGFPFTKFPGGGMEHGEGFKTTLIREFQEELNIEIEVEELFYFNEFYQESAFNPNHQLISFYYFVTFSDWKNIETDNHDVPLTVDGEKHRWVKLVDLDYNDFTFPIDKIVSKRLVSLRPKQLLHSKA